MSDLNRWQGIGRLGKDPDLKYLPSGDAVVNISIACGEKWKDRDGNKQESTEWVNVVAFKRLAEIMAEYLTKGSQVYIDGRLRTRKWQDKEGRDRYMTEVVAQNMQMLGGKQDGRPSNADRDSDRVPGPGTADDGAPLDDDIPF